jgi:hypothetical protein
MVPNRRLIYAQHPLNHDPRLEGDLAIGNRARGLSRLFGTALLE